MRKTKRFLIGEQLGRIAQHLRSPTSPTSPDLVEVARQVREAGTDRKWTELSSILQDQALTTDGNGRLRKLIVFTKHRDTLDYLTARIRALIGRPAAVEAIHGGVRRPEWRRSTEEFTQNSDCQILLSTDAAGENLN